MKKISDMTLAELQDYALSLEQDNATLNKTIEDKDTELKELNETNLLLQKRNNELFVKVEQGIKDPEPQPEPEVESCEDYALKNIKEIMI